MPSEREIARWAKKARLSAKAAAAAQGRDWVSLSREERKAFKTRARKEIGPAGKVDADPGGRAD